jgi:hypothetical protein
MKYFLKKFPEASFQVPPAHHNPIYLYSFIPGSKYNALKKNLMEPLLDYEERWKE